MIRVALAVVLLFAGLADAQESYDRDQWPHWRRSLTHACRTVRTEILARDALEVSFDPTGCYIVAGRWRDPYTGLGITDPRQLDVDHIVALKEAYERGGAGWPRSLKTDYANTTSFVGHLVVTSREANRKKGAKGPLEWQPPRREAWCGYAVRRAVVGYVWDLRASDQERLFLREMLAGCLAEDLPWR